MKKIALIVASLALLATPAFACPHEDKADKKTEEAPKTAEKDSKAKEAPKPAQKDTAKTAKPAEKPAQKTEKVSSK